MHGSDIRQALVINYTINTTGLNEHSLSKIHKLCYAPVESWPRGGAMASNSSKNRAQGAAAAARANRSRTPASEAPMYLLSSSGPLTVRNLQTPTPCHTSVVLHYPPPRHPCTCHSSVQSETWEHQRNAAGKVKLNITLRECACSKGRGHEPTC